MRTGIPALFAGKPAPTMNVFVSGNNEQCYRETLPRVHQDLVIFTGPEYPVGDQLIKKSGNNK